MNVGESAQDYLEMMYMLRERKGIIRSIDIAKELNVTKPSVSVAVKNLRENGYITMEKNGEIHLTSEGEAIAKDVFDRHVLLCSFLKHLGINDEDAHSDACKIEHDLSNASIEAIKKFAIENKIEMVDCIEKEEL